MVNLYSKCIITLFLISSLNYAQTEKGCGFVYAQDQALIAFKDYDANLKKLELIAPLDKSKMATVTLTIPVVFHVLHLNGAENISDAQIQDAVGILNTDFRKQNSDTTSIVVPFKNLAADCNIEFRLASLDPDGKCTNGITRHYDTHTDWDVDFSFYTYTWPANKYLNVYVVKTIAGGQTAGYTYLPGSIPPAVDAIVILQDYVGKIGTGTTGHSRALTHEVGHWLGLPHIWGLTNNPGVACGDDGVSDTPITKGHSFCNLATTSSCTPNVTENIQNYMEYSYCSKMYTIGQSNLMNGILASTTAGRNNVVSASNMTATGIINPNYNCAPKPEFVANTPYTCEGNQVTFNDYSYNGIATSWAWSSPGASNVSTIQNGLLTFTNTGLTPVKLKVGNSFGNDSTTKINFITVMANSGSTVNVAQDFETGTYPNAQWIASIPQYGTGFSQNAAIGASGQNCVYLNNYSDNASEPVNLTTPKYDLTNIVGPQLIYKYAFAQKGNSADQLVIYVTTDCGQSWIAMNTLGGFGMATTPSSAPVNTVGFVPQASEWRTQVISLSPYQTSTNAHFRFEFTPDPAGAGNNFYLDDINVTGSAGLSINNFNSEGLDLFPNPAHSVVTLRASRSIIKIEIFDIPGKQLESIEGSNKDEQNITIAHLPKGIYVLKVSSKNGFAFKKLVIE